MPNVTSFKVTGDWRHVVDDGMVDLDALPDEAMPTGHVIFTPISPKVAVAGAPAIAHTFGEVKALIAGGELTDLQGREGIWLAGLIGELPVHWRAVVNLEYKGSKIPYPTVEFQLTGDVQLSAIITNVGNEPPFVVDPEITDIITQATAEAKAAAAAAKESEESAATDAQTSHDASALAVLAAANAGRIMGSGSPDGAKDAPVGTIYVDTSNGELWHKTSPEGTLTGWKRVGEGAASSAKWAERDATTSDKFENLTFGAYGIPSGAVATALELPVVRYANLQILPIRISQPNHKAALLITNEGPSSGALEVWTRATNNLGVWQIWKKVFPVDTTAVEAIAKAGAWRKRALTTSDTLETLGVGWYEVPTSPVFDAMQLPTVGNGKRTGNLSIIPTNAADSVKIATWETNHLSASAPYELWKNATNGLGAWQGWQCIYPNGGSTPTPAPSSSPVDAGLGHSLYRQMLKARLPGGVVDCGTATPICFVWDDYPDYMAEYGIIDEIQRLGLKINFALCSRSFGEMAAALRGQNTSFADVNSWVATGLVEVSNHSARHRPAEDDARLYEEIVTSRQELEANLPAQNGVHTWVQPATEYPGFNNGDTVEAFSSTLAGQLIAGHHGFYTGSLKQVPDARVRLTGDVQGGVARLWVDSRTANGLFGRERIQSCYGTDRAYFLGSHASTLGQEGRWTKQQCFEFLQWLHDEQAAGRIKMLHLSEWPFAVNNYVAR